MFKLKSTYFKELGAIVFFVLLIQCQIFSQCQCPIGFTEIVIPAGQTITTSSIGGGFVNYCFNIEANATLEIDDFQAFQECRFVRDTDSKIVVTTSGYANFSGTGQNEILTCGPNTLNVPNDPKAGLIVEGGIAVYDLHMAIGIYGYDVGILAKQGSKIWVFDDLSIQNAFDQGIVCEDCSVLNLVNTQIIADCKVGISVFGRPSVLISNSGIYAQNSALIGAYFSTSSSIFRLENSTFSAGIGSTHSDTPTILVSSFSASPQSFLGNLNFIRDCAIEMNGVSRGVQMNGIDRFRIEGNDIDIVQVVGTTGSFNSGLYLTGMPNVRITDNNISFSGNNLFNQFTGLDLSGSLDCFIEGNTFDNVRTGVKITGNCSHPANPSTNNFQTNVFSGTQQTGLLVASGSQIGIQECHDNRWEGTFSNLGYDCQGNLLSNTITVNAQSLPVYIPTNNGAVSFSDACGVLTEFTGGGGSFLIANSDNNYGTLTLFPNPAKSSFSLWLPELDNNKDFIVELTDLIGKPIFRQKIDNGISQKNFNIDQLGSGVYLVHILSGDYRHTEKLIVTD